MLSFKAFLVSFDMLVALPIASFGIIFLLTSYHSSSMQLEAFSASKSLQLDLYLKSQEALNAIEKAGLGYQEASQLLANYSSTSPFYFRLLPFSNKTSSICLGNNICRIAEISNNSYFLVVSNETSS